MASGSLQMQRSMHSAFCTSCISKTRIEKDAMLGGKGKKMKEACVAMACVRVMFGA